MVLSEGVDLAGTDIRQIFDTTLEACEAACLADPACQAMTFNARNNSCFPKSAISGQSAYQGALSGFVREAAPGLASRAATRVADLGFLDPADLGRAFDQAAGLARTHMTGEWSESELLAAMAKARAAGDAAGAARLQGAALNLSDAADQWVEYARLTLASRNGGQGAARNAVLAAINGYLRAPAKPAQAEALLVLSQALERADRGRDTVPALRLAQALSPRDDIAARLDEMIGKYGFRVAEHQVESDSAAPRICAIFTETLARSGTDYASFVKLPQTGLTVDASGNQICVEGLKHGERYALTFREGLPSATGETLARDVTVTAYVRDRSPAVSFPGRAYILPRAVDAGLPVETVNTDKLDLKLLRVSDRNLVAAMRNDYFARSLDYWSNDYFTDSMAETLWSGTADVAMEVNRDITTRLPVQEVTGALGPGIYALQASVPGRDETEYPAATQWFVISDLGISTLSGSDGLHVVLRGLSDAAAREGVAVQLVSRANSVLGTALTDAQGYAHFDAGLTRGTGGSAPALVSATAGEDISFLSLTDPEFDLSDRGVEGLPRRAAN